MKGLLALLLAAASPGDVSGTYVLDLHETASALRLEEGGRYQWFFSQGALDLGSEGRWEQEGEAILLTSDPFAPPEFVFTGARSGGGPGVTVEIAGSGGRPLQGIDVLVQYASGEGDVERSGVDGRATFQLRQGDAVSFVALAEPVFGVRSKDFTIPLKAGQMLGFRLEANDWGKEAFQRLPLRRTAEGLRMDWRGQELDYRRAADD